MRSPCADNRCFCCFFIQAGALQKLVGLSVIRVINIRATHAVIRQTLWFGVLSRDIPKQRRFGLTQECRIQGELLSTNL